MFKNIYGIITLIKFLFNKAIQYIEGGLKYWINLKLRATIIRIVTKLSRPVSYSLWALGYQIVVNTVSLSVWTRWSQQQ